LLADFGTEDAWCYVKSIFHNNFVTYVESTCVEAGYLHADAYKFETSQNDESRDQWADSYKACTLQQTLSL